MATDPGNNTAAKLPTDAAGTEPGDDDVVVAPPDFASVYATYAKFVWRCTRRLGVPSGAVDDVVQDIFLVVYRRLPEFEARSWSKRGFSGSLCGSCGGFVAGSCGAVSRRPCPTSSKT
jgi:hypothetical protein